MATIHDQIVVLTSTGGIADTLRVLCGAVNANGSWLCDNASPSCVVASTAFVGDGLSRGRAGAGHDT